MLPGMLENETNPIMRLGLRLSGERCLPLYPYEEIYFLEHAQPHPRTRAVRRLLHRRGLHSASIRTVMGAGFDFIQLGRRLIFDPDFPKRAQADADHENGCTHCNRCATLIEAPGGIYCVERPANFA